MRSIMDRIVRYLVSNDAVSCHSVRFFTTHLLDRVRPRETMKVRVHQRLALPHDGQPATSVTVISVDALLTRDSVPHRPTGHSHDVDVRREAADGKK
jgi:hypothetical protein